MEFSSSSMNHPNANTFIKNSHNELIQQFDVGTMNFQNQYEEIIGGIRHKNIQEHQFLKKSQLTKINSRDQLFLNRYCQMKYELQMFLCFHSAFLILLTLYRIYQQFFTEKGEGDLKQIFKSFKKIIFQILIYSSAFLVKRLDFRCFRIFYVSLISLALVNTLHETMIKENEDRSYYVAHPILTTSVFYLYFSLFAPVSYRVLVLIQMCSMFYYFLFTYIRYGESAVNLHYLLQQAVVAFLIGRALYLKEQKDIQNIQILRQIDKLQRNYYGILQAIPEGVMIVDKKTQNIGFTNAQMVKIFQKNNVPLSRIDTSPLINLPINVESCRNLQHFKNSNQHNKALCDELKMKIKNFIISPIQHQLNNVEFSQDIVNSNTHGVVLDKGKYDFLEKVLQQYQDEEDNSFPFYYKMYPKDLEKDEEEKTMQINDQNQTQSDNFVKRRVEIKCKSVSKNKVLIILKDVTMFRELEKHKTQNRLKTLFFASFAHELMNPINIINGMNEECLGLVQTNQVQDICDLLFKSKLTIQKLVYLAEDIIDLSKYELKELKVHKSEFLLEEAIQEVLSLYQQQITLKKLNLEFNSQPSHNEVIYCDKKKLKRILNNLIGNAVKYTLNGYIKIKAQIKNLQYENSPASFEEEHKPTTFDQMLQDDAFIYCKIFQNQRNSDSNLQLNDVILQNSQIFDKNLLRPYRRIRGNGKKILKVTVEDSGIGIPTRQLTKLFKLFEASSFKGNINQGGMGIGLTSCFVLCKIMGGHIKAISTKHRGSKFQFYIDITQNSKYKSTSAIIQSSFEDVPLENVSEGSHPIDKKVKKYTPSTKDSKIRSKSLALIFNEEKKEDPILKPAEVLIVDDQEFNCEVAGRLIERQTGMKYDVAYSALEGIDKIVQHQLLDQQYKFIFLDINMPEMDGVQMVQQLRVKEQNQKLNFKQTKIFALTALDADQLGDIHDIGFDYFIPKPIIWNSINQFLQI